MFNKIKKKFAVGRLSEEVLYGHVARELEQGVVRDGLWAKAHAYSEGDDKKTKALYMQYRVQSLIDDHLLEEDLELLLNSQVDADPKLNVGATSSAAEASYKQAHTEEVVSKPEPEPEPEPESAEVKKERLELLNTYKRFQSRLNANSCKGSFEEVEEEFMDNKYYMALVDLVEWRDFSIKFKGEYWLLTQEPNTMEMIFSMSELIDYVQDLGDIEF